MSIRIVKKEKQNTRQDKKEIWIRPELKKIPVSVTKSSGVVGTEGGGRPTTYTYGS